MATATGAERDIHTSREFCTRLLEETGVAILPGSDFGRPEEELTARLAYVDFDGRQVLEAVAKLPEEQALDGAFLQRYCGRVLDAIDLLCTWIQ